MSDIRQGAQLTLAILHQELKGMGFGDDDQDINGGDFVEYGGQLFEDLGKALIEENAFYTRYLKALRATRDSLANWMEIQADEDARDYDAEALRLADEVLAGAPLPPPTMAERWVKLYQAWQDDAENQVYEFGEWLDQYHEGERETLTWIASWDARPVDGQLKADPRRATAFAVMDFGDGSIAIKRAWATIGDEGDRRWMVAS
uniref:Uncharacterized protein n=1 Tax=viral metagenome TaxID=1070528 RepID=A0A6M3KG89_9ZZZZ